jgi:hypothetical protein
MTVHISARIAWHDSGWNGRPALPDTTSSSRHGWTSTNRRKCCD